jgi:hypothetical protein
MPSPPTCFSPGFPTIGSSVTPPRPKDHLENGPQIFTAALPRKGSRDGYSACHSVQSAMGTSHWTGSISIIKLYSTDLLERRQPGCLPVWIIDVKSKLAMAHHQRPIPSISLGPDVRGRDDGLHASTSAHFPVAMPASLAPRKGMPPVRWWWYNLRCNVNQRGRSQPCRPPTPIL